MPQIEDRPSSPRASTRRVLAAAGLSATVLIAGCSAGAGHAHSTTNHPTGSGSAPRTAPSAPASTGESGSPRSTPTPLPTPHYKAVAVPPAIKQASHKTVASYLDALTQAMAQPEKKSAAHSSAVTGAALKALQAMQTEYAALDYHVVGAPDVVSERVLRVVSKDKRLVLGVCIDRSTVQVLDRTGAPVIAPTSATRTMNFLTIVKRGNGWAVAEQTFPANPNC